MTRLSKQKPGDKRQVAVFGLSTLSRQDFCLRRTPQSPEEDGVRETLLSGALSSRGAPAAHLETPQTSVQRFLSSWNPVPHKHL